MSGIQFNTRNGLSVGLYGQVIDSSGNGTLSSLTLTTPLSPQYGGIGTPMLGVPIYNGSIYVAATPGVDYVSPTASTTYTFKQTFAAASAGVSGSLNIPNTSTSNTPIAGDLYGTASGLYWNNGVASKLLAYADGSNISGSLNASISGNALTSTTATNLALGTAGAIPYQTGAGYTSFTAVGAAGYILQANGITAPTWINPASLTVAAANNISGVVSVVNGGTGATSPSQALTNLLPSGGVTGYVLEYNGAGSYVWAAQSGVNSAIGTTISIQRLTYTVGFSGVTVGQTIFTTPTYVPGSGQLKVFINGVRQFDSEYVETNTTTVTLNTGVSANDIILIEIDGYSTWSPIAIGIAYTPGGSITATDVQNAIIQLDTLKAPIASPTFTGTPRSNATLSVGDSSTQLATTSWSTTALNLKANLASPTFSGTPQAPTPATNDNTLKLATTAYVQANLVSYAPLANAVLTGTPTSPTYTSGSTLQIANVAYVQSLTTALFAAVHNVTGTRAQSTSANHIYTNTTGKPMMVSVTSTCALSSRTKNLALKVNGIVVSSLTFMVDGGNLSVTAIVSIGGTYEYLNISAGNLAVTVDSIDIWTETY